MATYVWKCQDCGHEQEVERPITESDVPPERCEGCGQDKGHLPYGRFWQKLIQRTSFTLQGGGWYKDSYQKGSSK